MSDVPSNEPPVFVCPTCGVESQGQFCRNCGEQKLGTEDRSLRHYADMAADFFTSFDSKAFRSIWLLVTRPGFLSTEQLRGSRVRYTKPLSLFVSINVIYFLSVSFFGANTFTTPLSIQLHGNNYYPGFAAQQVQRVVETKPISYEALDARFSERAGVLSKTLIFFFIPIYALLFKGLFFRRRLYFIEHLVVATHLWSFILLFLATVVPVALGFLLWIFRGASVDAAMESHDAVLSLLVQIGVGCYLRFMFKRVYAVRGGVALAMAILVASAFFHLVWVYRFLLFLISLYTL